MMGVVLWAAIVLTLQQCLVARASLLSLLTIVPFPSNASRDGWSQGLELVPAGLVALKHINDTPGILGGHTLELVVKEGEGCGASVVVKDIYSLYQELQVGGERKLVGVIGLQCSTPTGAVSKIAGRRGLDLIQISGATSPALSDSVTYPRLYRVDSSAGIVDAIISFMKHAKWKKISIYYDVYFDTIAHLLADAVRNDTTGLTLDNDEGLPFQADESIVQGILNAPLIKRNKITLITGTEYQCSVFLCAAYMLGRKWPGYVYMIHVLDRDVTSDIKATAVCDAQTMLKAIEGVITFNIARSPANDSVLVSGKTYQDYRLEYLQELRAYIERTGYPLDANGNIYANSLYDQVWSFALALNSSLKVLDAMNLSFENFPFNSGQISDVLEGALQKMEFQGAGGQITFKNNRQPITSSSIHQVVSGKPILVATYNGTLTIAGNFSLDHLPSDSIDRIYIFDPLWLTIIIAFISGLCLLLLVFNAALLICYRNEHDIKASSPSLSLLTFVGFILLIVSVLLFSSTNMFIISNVPFSVLCNTQAWLLSLGVDLIVYTLFFRLFRVYRLFQPNNFKKSGRVWRDESLFTYILLLTTYSIVILLVWMVSDPYERQEEEMYDNNATPPHFEVKQNCVCRYDVLWLGLLFLFPAVMTLGVILLAVLTRNVQKQHFKDTKKVNICIFSSILALVALLPLWTLLGAIQLYDWSHLTYSVAILFVPMACQVTLYAPKTVPYLCCTKLNPTKRATLISSTSSRRSHVSTKFSQSQLSHF